MRGLFQLLFAAAITLAANGQELDSGALLSRVQQKVRENAATIPKFICRQNIEREAFDLGKGTHACGPLGEHELESAGRFLVTSDRATLDVMLTTDSEMFAWPGAHSFDVANPDVLLAGGLSGSGDFATYAIAIFTQDAVTFEYRGPCERPGCVRFSYEVPEFASFSTIRTPLHQARLGYHGIFEVDPKSASLLNLTVVPTDLNRNLPEACDMRTRMTYTKATIFGSAGDAGEFIIPLSTERQYLSKDGMGFRNQVSYEGCHEYTSESALSFGDSLPEATPAVPASDPDALPVSGAEVQLRLTAAINAQGSAGDEIEARLVRPVRDRRGRTLPAGTLFRGHVTRLETVHEQRHPGINVSFRFESVVLDGKPVPVRLNPLERMDSHGQAVVNFPGSPTAVAQGFVSRWVVL